MLGDCTPRPPAGYNIYSSFKRPVPGHGLATLIRKDIPHMNLQLQTNLQATAFRIRLSRQYTICNIYLSPNILINLNDILNLIDQLPTPILLCGDFNSRHQLWDDTCTHQDARSRTIESLLLTSSLALLNNGNATHFHVQTGSSSAIDLSLCSATNQTDFVWSTMDDLYGSDHYPVIIEEVESEVHVPQERYLEHRADWSKFSHATYTNVMNSYINHSSTEELVDVYCKHIILAADIAIPRSSGRLLPRKVPWWNEECTLANRQRKQALRKYQRSLLVVDKIAYCRARAIAKRVKFEAKRTSWQKYVSSLNMNTPMKKIWTRIRKIRGSYQNHKASYLIKNGVHITDDMEIAELMADHYEAISSNNSYNLNFQRYRRTHEPPINFSTKENMPYNSPITIVELRRMLATCGNTAAGEDKITYNMIRKSHESCLHFLVGIYNKLFDTGYCHCNGDLAQCYHFRNLARTLQ